MQLLFIKEKWIKVDKLLSKFRKYVIYLNWNLFLHPLVYIYDYSSLCTPLHVEERLINWEGLPCEFPNENDCLHIYCWWQHDLIIYSRGITAAHVCTFANACRTIWDNEAKFTKKGSIQDFDTDKCFTFTDS